MRASPFPLPPLRPAAFLLAALALAAPAAAQAPGGEAMAPADPAQAAPPPPDLTRPPNPAPALAQPRLSLPRGMEVLPGGGWRLSGALARGTVDAPTQAALSEIAQWLAHQTTGRVTLLAQVAGPADDVSVARRDSLAHGLAVRRALESAGLDGTRIDVRPLGRTAEARDAVELLPPAGRAATRQNQSQARP